MNLDTPSSQLESPANLLAAGIAAATSGDEAQARTLLRRVVGQDKRNATVWLWLSSVVDNFVDLEVCLENAAALKPNNELIRQRLARVKQQRAAVMPPLVEQGGTATNVRQATKAQPVTRPVSTSDQPGQLDVQRQFICPQCASRMRFNPEIVDLQCQACGYIEVVAETPVQPSERVLNFVLRTQRGYRWANVERMLRCQQCGAQTVFPPAQTIDRDRSADPQHPSIGQLPACACHCDAGDNSGDRLSRLACAKIETVRIHSP